MCALCVYFQSVFENSCVPTRFIHVHRPSTCPSRRTTLNLPWIRARTERGRTGQFSIQVGQSRSSVPCTRLTLIFPISRHLRSHRYSNRFFARGEIVYRLENPKSIHRFQMWNTWLVTAQQVARLLLSSKIIFTRLFSFFFFSPPNFRKMESFVLIFVSTNAGLFFVRFIFDAHDDGIFNYHQ